MNLSVTSFLGVINMVVVTGPRSGSQGVSFVPGYWQVRVFRSFVLVDKPSEHLSIHNVPMSWYMEILSQYTPFSYQLGGRLLFCITAGLAVIVI